MKKKIIYFMLIFIGFLSMGQRAFAEGIDFSVKAIIPENQIDKKLTYFDLKMTPGQKQRIYITVLNGADKPIKVNIEPNYAFTNQNGVIDYSKYEGARDNSLKIAFPDLVKGEKEIELAANEVKEVPFDITMPEKSYDGLVLGGFFIQQVLEDEEKDNSDSTIQIKNKFSYVIGVKLTETKEEIVPNVVLHDILPGLSHYRTSVTANLQNTAACIINDLEVDAQVTFKGEKEVIHKTKKNGLSMAPNSNFDFGIDWDNKELKPGHYTLHLVAQSGEDRWVFKKDFEIKKEEAKKLNDEAVEIEQKSILPMLAIVIIILLMIIILLLAFYVFRKIKSGNNKR